MGIGLTILPQRRMDASASTMLSPLPYAAPSSGAAIRPAPLSEVVLRLADRHRYKLFIAIGIIYLLGFNGQWRLEPDSALYLTVGRNLAEGRGYTYHGQPHVLAFPGLPILFAGTFKIFHTERLLPALVLMLLMGLGTLGLTYRLFLLHAGRPTAVLMTFGLAISRLFYRYSFELLSDMPFLLAVMAFLVGYEAVFCRRRPGQREGGPTAAARWYDYVLLVGGLAAAVALRPAMWALLIAVVAVLLWSAIRGPRRWPQIIILLLALGITVGAILWRLDVRHDFTRMGQYEEALIQKVAHGELLRQMFGEYVPRLFEATLSQSVFGCPLGPGLNTLAGIAILIFGFALVRQRPLWGLWIAMTVVMVLVVIKPLDRYFLEVLPLLVYAWWRGIRWINLRLPQPWGEWAFLFLLLLGASTNLWRTGEFAVEQRWRPFRAHYKEGRFASTDQVVKILRQNVKDDQWVLAEPKFARILTFLSRRNVTGPNAEITLDPASQVLFVLEGPKTERSHEPDETSDDPVRQWLQKTSSHLGPQLCAPIQSRYDPEPWRLCRALPGRQ